MITEFPYQYIVSSGESVAVNWINRNEYQFRVIKNNGSTVNFIWYPKGVNGSFSNEPIEPELKKALIKFKEL